MTRSFTGRRRAEATASPDWIKPQLTKLVDEPPEGPEWLHEIKFDGYRMHARLDGGTVPADTHGARSYLDGELCGVRPDGTSSFSLMQAASDSGNTDTLIFFLFDLLYLDGEAIHSAPLLERKERLRELMSNVSPPYAPGNRGLWVKVRSSWWSAGPRSANHRAPEITSSSAFLHP
jgi:bifunctional non-homologous end joining protein LigD